jgi:hypothetical protein
MGEPAKKIDQLRAAWAQGDFMGALRIASKFFDTSPATLEFKRGWDAAQHADFYRQLGRDPEAITASALAALARKFKL